jgi:maleylpyruvate isomerase
VLHSRPVNAPDHDIEMVQEATRRLVDAAAGLDDDEMSAPCALPGWSRAELLTHVARNADSMRGLAEAALAGEIGVQYPGGVEQRRAGIAAGRFQPAAVVLNDLRTATDALYNAWRQLPPSAWDAMGRMAGGERTLRETVIVRWREVEVHHLDLDIGYTPMDWPVAFVDRALDEVVHTLPARAAHDRPPIDARYRIAASDHGRAWVVIMHGDRVAVADDSGAIDGPVDAEISGWGCDLLTWLLGRDTENETVAVSGNDSSALRLSTWFPYS